MTDKWRTSPLSSSPSDSERDSLADGLWEGEYFGEGLLLIETPPAVAHHHEGIRHVGKCNECSCHSSGVVHKDHIICFSDNTYT